MKEAKKMQVTEQICKQARLMRKGGANQTEIGKLLGINPCTVSRMEKAEFDFAKYQELLKERRAKERKQPEPKDAEEQVPEQIAMDLQRSEGHLNMTMNDQVKMMRFIAGQVDKLYMKLDKLNDTMSMILRAIRKE